MACTGGDRLFRIVQNSVKPHSCGGLHQRYAVDNMVDSNAATMRSQLPMTSVDTGQIECSSSKNAGLTAKNAVRQ